MEARRRQFAGAIPALRYIRPRGLFVGARLPEWVLTSAINASDKILMARVLMYSRYDANKCRVPGQCTAAVDTLAERTGLSVSSVRRSQRRLEALGLLKVTRRGGRTTVLKPVPPKGSYRKRKERIWIPLWVLPDTTLRPTAKLVYSVIAQAVGTSRYAEISYAEIAKRAQISRSTVVKEVKCLCKRDLLCLSETRRHENCYFILPVVAMADFLRADAIMSPETDPAGNQYLVAFTEEEWDAFCEQLDADESERDDD